jgi:hypothetical protein
VRIDAALVIFVSKGTVSLPNPALELRARPHHAKPALVSSKRLLGGCSRRLYLQGMSCAATICQTPARLSQVSVHTKQDFSSRPSAARMIQLSLP